MAGSTTPTERSSLTAAQQKKLDGVLAALNGQLKIKASDEKGQKRLAQFGSKYLRWQVSTRATGPHSHGFNKPQRDAIKAAVDAAFNIKHAPRKVAAPKKAPAKKASAKGKGRKGSVRKTTSQLAGEQQARAAS